MTEKRLKIGVVVDAVHELYQAGIWNGISAYADVMQVDLVTFVGTSQDGSAHFTTAYEDKTDTHYELISNFLINSDVDGIIVFTSPIANHHGKAYVKKLCDNLRGKPLVCVSEKVPGYDFVVVENGIGIELTIEHLVAVHNLRNIAFIKGPSDHSEAQERFDAYKRALTKNNLEYRPELVLEGGFNAAHGSAAMRKIFDDGIEIDGIVAVNDYSAFGAMDEIAQQDLLVPTDIAVTGFDDVAEATIVTPSLATVKQPLAGMGRAAIDSILVQLGKKEGESCFVLPTEPVYRRSCGCFSKKVEDARAIQQHIGDLTVEEVVVCLGDTAVAIVADSNDEYPGDDKFREMIESLVGSLIWDVQRPSIRHIFLNEVDILLHKIEHFGDTEAVMHTILRDLTMYAASLFTDANQLGEANNLLQQAGTFLREQLMGHNNASKLSQNEIFHQVCITNQRLVGTFDYAKLKNNLEIGFPALGINSLSVVLFNHSMPVGQVNKVEGGTLFFAYNITQKGGLVEVANKEFTCKDIFPKEIRPINRSLNHIFMALHFENIYIGYVVFEFSKNGPLQMYEELRSHLSSALAGCFLNSK